MPGVPTSQAERRFVTFDVGLKVATTLSADWIRPSRWDYSTRTPHAMENQGPSRALRPRSSQDPWRGIKTRKALSCTPATPLIGVPDVLR